MQTPSRHITELARRASATIAIVAVCVGLSLLTASIQANPVPVEVVPAVDVVPGLENFVLVRSDFLDNARFGKDPFFPKSVRRGKGAPVVTDPGVEPVPVVLVTGLSLKGVSGRQGRRLCIINNRTFSVGETAEMRDGKQIVKVQCIEIKDKSVTVTVNGVSKELTLSER